MKRWIFVALLMTQALFAFEPKAIAHLKEEGDCPACDLSGADLRGWDLAFADLHDANLSHARLDRVKAHRAIFDHADLSGASFEGANLKGAPFKKANLEHVDFKDARLWKADFSGAKIDHCRFDGAALGSAVFAGNDLENSTFDDVILYDTTFRNVRGVPLQWHHDLEEALQEAAIEGKEVLMFYSAVWCPGCQFMKNKAFKDPSLGAYLAKRFVLLNFDVDKDQLPKKYLHKHIPAFFVLDAKGYVEGKIEGASKADKFLNKLKSIH